MSYNSNPQETNQALQDIARNTDTAAIALSNPVPVTIGSPVVVSSVTAPVTVASITAPLSISSIVAAPVVSSTAAVTSVSVLLVSVQLIAANPNRKALTLYNNSANSVYLCTASPASSSTNLFAVVATFTTYSFLSFVYTGALYAIRNSGSGSVVMTEFT